MVSEADMRQMIGEQWGIQVCSCQAQWQEHTVNLPERSTFSSTSHQNILWTGFQKTCTCFNIKKMKSPEKETGYCNTLCIHRKKKKCSQALAYVSIDLKVTICLELKNNLSHIPASSFIFQCLPNLTPPFPPLTYTDWHIFHKCGCNTFIWKITLSVTLLDYCCSQWGIKYEWSFLL